MKTAFIVLAAAALALSVITYFVVFFPSGSYAPVLVRQGGSGATTSFGNFSALTSTTSMVSSTPGANAATSTPPAAPSGTYATEYAAPYPVSWDEGHERFSVTGASLQGNQFTLDLAIQMGNTSECVPLNIRFVADEAGTMKLPDSPPNGAFIFPDTQSCNGTPGATYSRSLAWTVDPALPSFLFTTGGAANVYFLAATTTPNGMSVTFPPSSG